MAEDGARLWEELMRFKPDGMTANAWAVKAGVSRTIWADLKRHGNPSRRTLEKLLVVAGSSLAEFEALRVGASPQSSLQFGPPGVSEPGSNGWRQAPLAPVPLIATGLAGEWSGSGKGIDCHSIDPSKVIGKVDRPTALAADRNAYAVTIVGKSMWPRFRAGRRLLVSPAARVQAGDDVLVRMADGKVLIKELVGRSPSMLELRQFHPDVMFKVKSAEIEAMHKVLGEAI